MHLARYDTLDATHAARGQKLLARLELATSSLPRTRSTTELQQRYRIADHFRRRTIRIVTPTESKPNLSCRRERLGESG